MDRRRSSRSDKNLVTEQVGAKVVVIGIVMAVLIGYVVKSLLSPARVSAQIQKAASHIHKDLQVSFEGAQVSLSNGVLPRFSVVITKVRLESTRACWMSPLLEADEIRLPISIWGIITGKSAIKRIEADNVELTLREKMADCGNDNAEKNGSATQLVTLSQSEQAQKYQDAVGELAIQDLKIRFSQYPQYPSEFMDFQVKVKSFEPKVIEITTQTRLLRDEQVGDYLSHANLFMQYKESPEPEVQAHFFGNWREGHYSIIANYLISDHMLSAETDLQHIPLSQVLSLLQKYDLVSRDLNGRQAWISTTAKLRGDVNKINSAPLDVRNFRVEGDLGELYAEQLTFTSLQPLRYQPILIDVKKLNVENLLTFLSRSDRHRILGNLGAFSGQAEIRSENYIRLFGEYSGLEFKFSNKGERELQMIDRMQGSITLDGNYWNFAMDHIEPHGGVLQGNVTLKADRDFKDVQVKTHIDQLVLAVPVQKLMTNGGHIGNASFNAEAKMTQGNLSTLKGLLRIDGMNVENMEFGATKADFDYSQGDIVLNTKVQSLDIAESSPAADILKPIADESLWTTQTLKTQDISGQFRLQPSGSFLWRNFQGKIGKSRFNIEGGWNKLGELKGQVQLHEPKSTKKWTIQGTREKPIFQ